MSPTIPATRYPHTTPTRFPSTGTAARHLPVVAKSRVLSAAILLLFVFVAANPLASHGAEPTVLFVATSGNDTWSGKLAEPNAEKTDGPFASIARARDAIRAMKAAGGLPAGGVVVEILAGRYELAEPFELTAEDSGTAECPIVYQARPGDVVRISGGRFVAGWQPVTAPDVLNRLDPSARGNVVQVDLKAQGITEYGEPGIDAAGDLQKEVADADCQGEYTMGSVPPTPEMKKPECLEVFFNDEAMPISRGPNEGAIKIEEILGSTIRDVRSHISCVEGIFQYEGDYPRRWAGEKEVWVLGSWSRDWAEQRHKVESLDPEQRVISVTPPYHHYGYAKGQWFFGFNLLPELDRPGEWCIDRETGVLYFWPPAPIESAKVEVSMSQGLVKMTEVKNVTLRGLVFEATRGTAVAMARCEQCRVVGSTLRNLGIHAVTVRGGKENGVAGCDMYGMGGGGIYLIGGERKTLTPAGHFAENNHIHHYARWNRMYRPGIVFSGVGQRASHNLIHSAPHAAIIFGGNDHVIEFNEIHDVCLESNDCGAIYAGRDWTIRGTVIRNNYLHHLKGREGRACRGIYLDDLFSGARVEGNVFYQTTFAVFIGGGRDNIVENNIFVDCPMAMHVDARGLGWCGPHADGRIKEATEQGTIRGIHFAEPPFSTRYPELVNLLNDEPKAPKGNVVRHNILWPGAKEDLRRAAKGTEPTEAWWDHIDEKSKPLVKLEDNLINTDPLFVDEKACNFQLRPESPALGIGFQPIPFEKIGLYQDEARASWPVTSQASAKDPLHARKILFLGNSITLCSWSEDLGSLGPWGMAASTAEKDYVHIVTKAITEKAGAPPETLVKNIADFERQYATFDVNTGLKDALDFKADLVILAIGENVPAFDSEDAKTKFANGVKSLLKSLNDASHPTFIVRSCFWPNKTKDDILEQACEEIGGTFVYIGQLAADESNYARSERTIEHAGIAAHPGDKGMQGIADAILAALNTARP